MKKTTQEIVRRTRGRDTNGASHLYTFVTGNRTTGGDLMVDGAMLIKDYKPGQGNGMGITFSDAAAQTNPTTTHDIKGDPLIHTDTVVARPSDWTVTAYVSNAGGTQTVDYFLVDAERNPIEGGQQDRADSLTGTAANDHIMSGALKDTIHATQGGDDLIEAGSGNVVFGEGGNDRLSGAVRMRWSVRCVANDSAWRIAA